MEYMTGLEIRKRLRAGGCVFGTHITTLPNPNATLLSAQMDLDFAFFCTEHLPLDRNEISLLCRFYARECGASPIVRVPASDDTDAMSMALDAGAEGIIVPYVETEEEVRNAAAVIRHRPIKGRLQRELRDGKRELSPKMAAYLETFNRNNYLIIGIESVPALENLDALLTAAEVDAVFLGPHDITTSMGIPEEYGHPDFIATIEDTIRRCRRHNVGVGIHLPLLKIESDTLRRWLEAGMNLLINGTDIAILREAMNAQIRQLRELTQTSLAESQAPDEQKLATCIA